MSVEIKFKNKTNKIEAATVIINGLKFHFKGNNARELATMASSDKTTIKNYIESLVV